MIQRTKCELISRVHRRKATILPTSRKWMISQGKRDGWILSRMRLLADDIVSFSIPLPFFTHLLISLSLVALKSEARRCERKSEREVCARGSKTSHRLRTSLLSLDCSTLSCFNGCSSSSCSLSLEKGEVFGTRKRERER